MTVLHPSFKAQHHQNWEISDLGLIKYAFGISISWDNARYYFGVSLHYYAACSWLWADGGLYHSCSDLLSSNSTSVVYVSFTREEPDDYMTTSLSCVEELDHQSFLNGIHRLDRWSIWSNGSTPHQYPKVSRPVRARHGWLAPRTAHSLAASTTLLLLLDPTSCSLLVPLAWCSTATDLNTGMLPSMSYAISKAAGFLSQTWQHQFYQALRLLRLTIWTACPPCSISGYCFPLGFSMVSWASHKQALTANSSCYAKYIALHDTGHELIFLWQFLDGMPISNISAFATTQLETLSLTQGKSNMSAHLTMLLISLQALGPTDFVQHCNYLGIYSPLIT